MTDQTIDGSAADDHDIECVCAQVHPDEDGGDGYTWVLMPGDRRIERHADTERAAWLALAMECDDRALPGLADRCRGRARSLDPNRADDHDASAAEIVRLPNRLGMIAPRPGVPGPTPSAAAVWADNGPVSQYEAQELRRAFDECDSSLRTVISVAVSLLRELHAGALNRGDEYASTLGQHLGRYSANTARLRALDDGIHHRRVLHAKTLDPSGD